MSTGKLKKELDGNMKPDPQIGRNNSTLHTNHKKIRRNLGRKCKNRKGVVEKSEDWNKQPGTCMDAIKTPKVREVKVLISDIASKRTSCLGVENSCENTVLRNQQTGHKANKNVQNSDLSNDELPTKNAKMEDKEIILKPQGRPKQVKPCGRSKNVKLQERSKKKPTCRKATEVKESDRQDACIRRHSSRIVEVKLEKPLTRQGAYQNNAKLKELQEENSLKRVAVSVEEMKPAHRYQTRRSIAAILTETGEKCTAHEHLLENTGIASDTTSAGTVSSRNITPKRNRKKKVICKAAVISTDHSKTEAKKDKTPIMQSGNEGPGLDKADVQDTPPHVSWRHKRVCKTKAVEALRATAAAEHLNESTVVKKKSCECCRK